MAQKLYELAALGQSMWYDNIARDLLVSGEIQRLVDDGVLGMTSNPAIFKQAITSSAVYDPQLNEMARKGHDAMAIYEAMAIQDIQHAADILRPVYDRTKSVDGYVSLEVSPFLAHDTKGTIEEAARLATIVNRPNVMIKIPATPEGLPAVEESLANGLNVNITLIFSLDAYQNVMEAFLKGLERRHAAGKSVSGIASVASFFVSRVDTLVDSLIDQKGGPDTLKGKAAVANARLAYQLFKQKFSDGRWAKLAAAGAMIQRPLWASTSTKNPAYPDIIYVDNLIGPNTVNTAPPQTIAAFVDHGVPKLTLEDGVAEARAVMDDLAAKGINMTDVTDELLADAVKKFNEPFQQLLGAIESKRSVLVN